MERVRLTPPDERRARGEKARLYIRWMPRLGAEAVALYELLRTLPDAGVEAADTAEIAELMRSTPEAVQDALDTLLENGFATERDGWIEVHDLPPGGTEATERREAGDTPEQTAPRREIEVVRAEPEGVSADDYFKYMGTLPAPHILEFLNGYCGRDGVDPEVVREALRIASERDARRVGYVRSIMERWVERGVKTAADVERFEQDRKLRLVAEGGGSYGEPAKEVNGGTDRQPAAGVKEGYEWFFGE